MRISSPKQFHGTLFVALVLSLLAAVPAAAQHRFYKLMIRDSVSRQVVGCATLRTTHGVEYTSDRFGVIAFYEPGLMDKSVYFSVEREGHRAPLVAFGVRGTIRTPREGASEIVFIDRVGFVPPCTSNDAQSRLVAGFVTRGR